MQIPALRYLPGFLAIVSHGTLARAAEQLAVTQPTLSYQIRRLEDWLGVPVFERSGRRLQLTGAGRALRDWAQRTMAEAEGLRSAVRNDPSMAGLALRLHAGASFGRYVLSPLLLGRPPWLGQARIELRFGSDEETFAAVENGSVDAGFVYVPRVSARLDHRPVYEEQLVMVAAASQARPLTALRTLKALAAQPYITYEESDSVYALWFRTKFGRLARTLGSAHHVSDIEEAAALVRAGWGVAVLPRHAIEAELSGGRLQEIDPQPQRLCRNMIYAVTRVQSYAPPLLESLLAAVGDGEEKEVLLGD